MGAACIRGVVGQIKWQYYVAAAVNGYTVTRSATTHEWHVTGAVVLADTFKMAQRPLTFVAPHAQGEWRWRIIEITRREDGGFTATLGPLEGL